MYLIPVVNIMVKCICKVIHEFPYNVIYFNKTYQYILKWNRLRPLEECSLVLITWREYFPPNFDLGLVGYFKLRMDLRVATSSSIFLGGGPVGTPVLNVGARYQDWWKVPGTGGQAAGIRPGGGGGGGCSKFWLRFKRRGRLSSNEFYVRDLRCMCSVFPLFTNELLKWFILRFIMHQDIIRERTLVNGKEGIFS